MNSFFMELVRSHVLTGVLILAALLWLVIWVARQPPGKPRLYLLQAGIVTTIVALMALVMTQQLHWLFALTGGMLPLVVRAFQVTRASSLARRRRPASESKHESGARGSSSESRRGSRVETRFLRLFVDRATGEMRGKVIKGAHVNAHLSELSRDQLRQLHKRYVEQDAESATLLAAYLENARGDKTERTDGAGAKESAKDQSSEDNAGARQSGRSRHKKGNGMTHDEAYEILGLQDGADARAVTEAHRRLMQKLHPDRGGTNYLAAKINQAKDLLLAR